MIPRPRPRSAAPVAILLFGIAATAWACARTTTPVPAPRRVVGLVPYGATIPSPPDGGLSCDVAVEVVWKDADRQRGLGGRKALGEGAGMLFVYKDDRVRAFWMKDCFIALDVAYLRADGEIVKIATLPPGADAAPGAIPQASSVLPCRYVLEVTDGWFRRRGLAEGARVDVAGVIEGVVPE